VSKSLLNPNIQGRWLADVNVVRIDPDWMVALQAKIGRSLIYDYSCEGTHRLKVRPKLPSFVFSMSSKPIVQFLQKRSALLKLINGGRCLKKRL